MAVSRVDKYYQVEVKQKLSFKVLRLRRNFEEGHRKCIGSKRSQTILKAY